MSKKILLLLALLATSGSPLYLTGCSSSDEQGQSDQASTDDGVDSDELAEDETVAGEAPAEGAPEAAPEAAPPAGDDIVADLGDDPTAEQAGNLPDQAMGTEAPPADQAVADNNVPPPADTVEAPPSEPVFEEPPPAPKVSLKKIKDAPFTSNGRILNTVYVARKGDTLNSVAEKTLGDKKRKKELIADNGFLSRGVKEGDKIYYNSPKRPDDSTTMMTFYEDNGVPAQTYTAQEGDNLRTLAKTLLGSREGWKELWSTNPNVESKGDLDPGTELRYWPEGAQAVASAPPAPPPMAAGTTQPPPDMNALPPPVEAAPPPPPAPEVAALPPPPPPAPEPQVANDFPPPPPPPTGVKKPAQTAESFLFQDQETTMAIGAGGIILISVVLIILGRVKKSRANRMRLGQTQV